MTDNINDIDASDLDSHLLTDEYKAMVDQMLLDEVSGDARYVSFKSIKERFLPEENS